MGVLADVGDVTLEDTAIADDAVDSVETTLADLTPIEIEGPPDIAAQPDADGTPLDDLSSEDDAGEALDTVGLTDVEGDVDTSTDGSSNPQDADTSLEVFNPCDDENPCTIDTFDGSKCVNTYEYGICCTANPMCDDTDPCTEDLCVLGLCRHEAACCASDAECVSGETVCEAPTCVNGACVQAVGGPAGCCQPTGFIATFDDGTTGGITFDNTYLDVGWYLADSIEATSPPGSLRYGDKSDSDYDNGVESRGSVLLPVLHIPGGVRTILRFDLLLDIEPSGAYDLFYVDVVDQATKQIVRYWDKSKAIVLYTWQEVQLDISAFGGTDVQIRFRFDTVDNQQNELRGVFLDNIQVGGTCDPLVCELDADCDDAFPYTTDRCHILPGAATGACAWLQSSTWCANSSECDDGEPCTSNFCTGNVCVYSPNASCCLADAECEDGNACTADDCSGLGGPYGGQCIHIPKQSCCSSAFQCDDSNVCTEDGCPVAGEPCVHIQKPGCCSANADCNDADACTVNLCDGGQCVSENACCSADAGCDDGNDACTVDTCEIGLCQRAFVDGPECCKTHVLASDFYGGNVGGFASVADSNAGDGVGWVGVTDDGTTPFGALHFGTVGATYATEARVFAAVESGAFPVPVVSAVSLSFQVRIDNEWSNGQGSIQWDRVEVSIHDTVTDEVVPVWSSAQGAPVWWTESEDGTPNGSQWTVVAGLDLNEFRGRQVRLKIAFDSVDEEANAFGGVWVDDVLIAATCE